MFQTIHRDSGLSRVPADGGRVEPATVLDVTGPDVTHRLPVFLPDGVHSLYLVVSTNEQRRGIYLASTALPAREPLTRLFQSASGPVVCAPAGSLIGPPLSAEGRWIEVWTLMPHD